jgi:hypothetical protein
MNVTPYARPIDYGEARVDCDWPYKCGPRQFRGAVIAQMATALHVSEQAPWTMRDAAGETLKHPPQVLYRVHRGFPMVFCVGDDAHHLLTQLAYHLTHVHLPGGESLSVRHVQTRAYEGEVRVLKDGWASYRLVTPYFPSKTVEARRPPRYQSRYDVAWASFAIESSLRMWAKHHGVEDQLTRPIHTIVADIDRRKVVWERPQRDMRDIRRGFKCAFVSNLLVPPGIGLGAKISEGFGELELLGCWGGS